MMKNDSDTTTQKQAPIGVLLTNLGTPDTPTAKAVRRYLAEFLSDQRVVELPKLLWLPILYGIILTVRPKKSAANYQKVWTNEGSPLLVIGKAQATALQETLGDEFKVVLGMRYGNPSIDSALQQLQHCDRIIVLPLYPQYSGATTGSTFDAVTRVLSDWRRVPALSLLADYHHHDGYIDALAQSVEQHWDTNGRGQKLVLSYHGLPQRCIDNGDPYYDHCKATTDHLIQRLGLTGDDFEMVFQSRFGAEKWLQPYCLERLQRLPNEGVKHIDVICPGFSADCVETLEEIAITNREEFMTAGGERYDYIPALNANAAHIDALRDLIIKES